MLVSNSFSEYELSRINLNFKDSGFEKLFRQSYFKKSLPIFRIAFILVTLLYVGFGFFDKLVSPDNYKVFFSIRFFVVFPILAGVFALSFTTLFKKTWQSALMLCFVVSGTGIIYMIVHVPDNLFYYSGLFLVFLAGFFFIRLRFLKASIAGFLLLLLYNFLVFTVGVENSTPTNNFLLSNSFYVSTILIASFSAYYIEKLERKEFIQRETLRLQQRQIAEANNTLEQKVNERTNELHRKNEELKNEITQKTQFEAALNENKKRFEAIFKQAATGIAIADVNGEIIDANPKFAEMLGYTKNELLKLSVADITPPADMEKETQIIQQVIEGKTDILHIEKRYIHKDGHIIWASLSSRAVRNRTGNIQHIIGIVADITKQKHSENEIRTVQQETEKLKELFSGVLNNIPDLVSIHDADFNIIFSNWNGFGNIPHQQRKLPLKCYKAYRNYNQICPDCKAKEVLKTRQSIHSEIQLSDGKWYDLRVLPINSPNSEKQQFVEWVRDITKIKQNEMALKKRNEQLKRSNKELVAAKEKAEESDKLKTTFLQNISHEFRTPMNGILGFSELLITPGKTTHQKQKYIDMIHESCNRLLDIVTDTIEMSQIQNNMIDVNLSDVNLFAVVDDIMETAESKIRQKGLKLRVIKECKPDEAMITTDYEKIKRTLKHIVDNAIKFTNKGGVEVKCGRRNGNTWVEVTDTGIGIRPEQQKLIFQPFGQVETGTTRSFGGNGIGLSLVKSYMELLGGRIGLQSEPGTGTKVQLTIPVNSRKKTSPIN